MVSDAKRDPLALAPAMLADAAQVRRISGRAVRLGLDRQLDLRLDLMLDSGGVSIISIKEVFRPGEHYDAEIGPVLRCFALLSVVGTQDAVDAEIDLLLRDYAALTPIAHEPDQRRTLRAADIEVTAGDLVPDEDSPTPSVLVENVQARRGAS